MAILHQEIPDDLHRALKMEAASRSMTLKDLIVGVLTDEIDRLEVLDATEQSAK